jgi:YggT family protein
LDRSIEILSRTFLFLQWMVIAAIIAVIALMVIRLIITAADPNPFNWISRTSRRLSDPFVMPVRGGLMRATVDPKFAPLVVILITILLGWFFLALCGEVAGTLGGLILSFKRGDAVSGLGFILYGAISIYMLLIFIRIVFSWGMLTYRNRVMRFLIDVTEPLLGPLRRIIPPLGMMDISPIFAFLILWLLKMAVQGTLIRGGIPQLM